MLHTFKLNGKCYYGSIQDAETAYYEAISQDCILSFEEYVDMYCEEYISTSDLFKKHFGDTASVGMLHPNIESFFEELNDVCKREDVYYSAK